MTIEDPVNEIERDELVDRDMVRRAVMTETRTLLDAIFNTPIDTAVSVEDLFAQSGRNISSMVIEFRRRQWERHQFKG